MAAKTIENNDAPRPEGLLAYAHALQTAQKTIQRSRKEGTQAVRRISRSLKSSPQSQADPDVLTILTNIEKANDSDIERQLRNLLSKLDEVSSRYREAYSPILVIDDDPRVAHVLQKQLASFHRHLLVAKNIKEATALLAEKDVSLVILNLILPDGDGRDFLMLLRESPPTASLPVIVLSATDEGHVQSECFALGADGYFKKPFDPAVLLTVVQAKIQRSLDSAQEATMDAVTQLPNRQVFHRAFNRARRLASRNGAPLTVALLDLDRFKSVNEVYGHAMGDQVLRNVSTLLQKSLRSSDLVARWGGEEFAILFPNTSVSQAHQALEKTLKTLRAMPYATPDGRTFQITFSAGVTHANPEHTAEKAIAEADQFLHAAKISGRNHILSQPEQLRFLKCNILLVEDDEFMASLECRMLEKRGFRVFHARTGAGALSLIGDTVYSLITLDVKLPDMDGFDLLARLRKHPATFHVPVIMLTAADKEVDIVRGFKLGADDYIVKPFSPTQFLARVHRILERQ